MNAIEVTKLRKTYPGGAEAVKGIDFEVATGEVFGLLGPNGAGKTTTVGMLTTTSEHTAGSYSGGERRRLEIGRALVSRPRVLFLDEPTVGLDPRIRAELLEVIASLRNRTEMTVLLTTHYLDEAERLCDRVAIIHAGRIVALDTTAALLGQLGKQLVELRVDGDVSGALAFLREHGVAGRDAFAVGSRLTVPLHDTSSGEAIAAIHQLGLTGAISAREPTLDDVYLRLTGDSLAAAA